jgi:hypothetical protein
MVIYDIEIANAMPPRDGILQAGINYCKGWQDYDNVGISVICAYDYTEDRYRVFCGDNLESFSLLINNCEILVGFNNKAFDDRVLSANGITLPTGVKSYDLLQECWRASGIDIHLPFHPTTHSWRFFFRKIGTGQSWSRQNRTGRRDAAAVATG